MVEGTSKKEKKTHRYRWTTSKINGSLTEAFNVLNSRMLNAYQYNPQMLMLYPFIKLRIFQISVLYAT